MVYTYGARPTPMHMVPVHGVVSSLDYPLKGAGKGTVVRRKASAIRFLAGGLGTRLTRKGDRANLALALAGPCGLVWGRDWRALFAARTRMARGIQWHVRVHI